MRSGRLKNRPQFLQITQQGHKAVTRSFVVFCRFNFVAEQHPGFHQFDTLCGFTVTKKLGNAVTRNRIKRRLRAVMRDVLPECESLSGSGIVIVGRYGALKTPYDELCAEARKCFNYLRKQK
ncbi:MAG: ribonuclease P protein component [Pseudomonadota bacterium]